MMALAILTTMESFSSNISDDNVMSNFFPTMMTFDKLYTFQITTISDITSNCNIGYILTVSETVFQIIIHFPSVMAVEEKV